MMISASEAGKKYAQDSEESRKLLTEIEAISKALYVDKSAYKGKVNRRSASIGSFPEPKEKSKNVGLDDETRDKKSFWNWKPLKALSHTRNKRFNCCFSLIVHSIDGLPSGFDGASLRVHWKRKDGEMVTHCGKVVDGVAEFDQRLTHTCSVYGSRSGQHHSAKYEAKHFLLYATLFGSPELDLGKHRVDLTRLLPLTLEELEEEKSSGRWTTDFKLSGKARGATMHVSFGYSVVKDKPPTPPLNNKVAPGTIIKQSGVLVPRYGLKLGHEAGGPSMRRTGSLPSNPGRWPHGSSPSVEDIKVMHEVLPNPSADVPSMVKNCSKADKEILETSVDKPEFDVFTVNLQPLDHSSSVPDSDKENVENGCKKNEILAPQQLKQLLVEELDENVNIKCDVKFSEASIGEANIERISKKSESFVCGNGNSSLGTGPDENVCTVEHATVVEREEARMQNECEKSFSEQGTKKFGEELNDPINGFEDIKIVSESSTREVDVELVADPTMIPLVEPVEHKCLDEVANNQPGHQLARDEDIEDVGTCSKTDILEELKSALEVISGLELDGLNYPEDEGRNDDILVDDAKWKGKSNSFDYETDSVASEFLNLLGMEDSPFGLSSESEPESPRERLLRQFEKDSMADGFPLFDYSCFEENSASFFEDGVSEEADLDHETDDFELSSMILAAEEEYLAAIESEACKTKAKMLEDMETEALMHEWGLNEKAFVGSPSPSPPGFGHLGSALDGFSELPPLGEGLGPFIQTKDGGYIRSMKPSVFENAKSGGSLVMQVSSLVVVPAEMGSDVMGILQGLASIGIEKLSMQAKKLMPLEDITGKTMQQVAWEASPNIEPAESQFVRQREGVVTESRRVKMNDWDKDKQSEYVSLEDLAPLAMDKIEALSMEGLRTQAGLSSEDAPSIISAASIGDISALKGRSPDLSSSLGMEGTAGLQLVDVKDSTEDVDGLMGLSLTLDEWMRLDSGEFDNDGDDQISERTSKILAAHHANSLEQIRNGSRREKRKGKGSSKKCGLLGNNFTVASLVQLRDPFRNYEPVGTPMLALVQVERVFQPPKPRIFRTVTQVDNSEDDEPEIMAKVATKNTREGKIGEEENIPQYRITEVHVAGLKVESSEKKLWGSKTHQQSGSRWLVANGMGKPNKHPLLKSKDAGKSKSSTPAPAAGSSLWSISSLFWGGGSKPKESSDATSHKRNPDIIFESAAAKLR